MSATEDKKSTVADSDQLDAAMKLVGAGVAARLAGTAAGVVGGFATTSLAVRLLGLESYGTLAFGISMLAIVAAVTNSGLGLATVQRASQHVAASEESRSALVGGALTAGVLVGVGGGVLLMIILYLRGLPFGAGGTAAFAVGLGLLLVGRSVATVALSTLRGFGRVWLTEIPDLVLLFGQLAVVSAASLAQEPHVWIVAGGYGGVGLVGAIGAVLTVRFGIVRGQTIGWSLSAAKRMFAIAWPLAIVAVATQVLARLDVVILGFLRSAEEVGAYEPTLKLVDRLMQMTPLLLLAAYLPASTRLHRSGQSHGFRHLYRTTAKIGYMIGFPALLLLACFPQPALRTLYGSNFPVLEDVVVILLVGYAINLAVGLNTTALISTGQNREITRIYLAVFGIVIASALVLIPTLGTAGAALSTALGYLSLNVIASWVLFRQTRAHIFDRGIIVTLVTSLVALGAGIASSILWKFSSIFPATAIVVLIWGVWVTSLFLTGALNKDELKAFAARS